VPPRRRIFCANINTALGAVLALSFGLFVLTLGFNLVHMTNPISEALAKQMQTEADLDLN